MAVAPRRLSFWLGPDGKPLPPPSMQAAARREAERRERELHLADQQARAHAGITARTRDAGTDPAPRAARIREQMGWTPEAPGNATTQSSQDHSQR